MNWREREADRNHRRATAFTKAPKEASEYVEVMEKLFFAGRETRGKALTEESLALIHRTAWKLYNMAKYGGTDGGSH